MNWLNKMHRLKGKKTQKLDFYADLVVSGLVCSHKNMFCKKGRWILTKKI